ncbi:ribosomal protein L17 [Cokeromyces recurvatus]|uniref:ribosomal protein L17 n=1 Tax=Cokeromyces recurvatus TaxID=90255 RepID=UPI00221ECCFF|nr:ribosomal protein L17 [Cokeromyces recurvatus]KAI7902969.1 ribosomal protein L17 [Cokeromyces recurvatus]
MHHGKHLRRLNRPSGHRKALLRNLVSSLIEHGRIETTVAKAKTIQPIADSMITLGKKGDVEAKRKALGYLNSRDVTIPKLFEELAPRFANRQGGYTRIQRIGKRYGDNAPMAVIEYIDGPNDLKREMITSTLANKFKSTSTVSVTELLNDEQKVKDLGLSKSLIRDLKKVQFSNSIESIENEVQNKMVNNL